MKLTLKFLNLFFVFNITLMTLANPVKAEEIDITDLSVLKDYNFLFRSKNYLELKTNITTQKDPSYLESYLMGNVLKKERHFKESALWFARAAFKFKELPPAHSFEVIKSYMDSGIRRSGVYPDCVYELAWTYLSLGGPGSAENASKMLELLPRNVDPVLGRKILELRVEIIGKLNPAMAIEIYQSILKDFKSPLIYLRLGGLNYRAGIIDAALENYFQALAFPQNDWTFIKAAAQINILLEKYPGLNNKIDNFRKVQLAEAMRIDRRYHQSLTLWKTISVAHLKQDELGLYVQNYCRLNISMRQYYRCHDIILKHKDILTPEQKEKVYLDAAERLYSSNQYELITRLIPPGEFRGTSLYRIRSLEKIRHANRRTEAADYLKRYDSDSTYAEGVFFSSCFEYIEVKNHNEALSCLNELASLTVNVSSGGRARYFIGRIYEDLKEYENADKAFKEVYLNSPEHFYAFGALAKVKSYNKNNTIPLPDLSHFNTHEEKNRAIRTWIADNFNNDEALKSFFAEKKKKPEFGIDSFWIDFEKKLKLTEKSLTESEKKASAYLSMGLDSLAEEYFTREPSSLERKFQVFLNSAILSEDAYLKATYIQALLSVYKKQADVMTMSALASDCLYPTPFRSIVSSASEKYSVEEAQVYALMKQESGFHPGATSRSGAKGLMQIMPATATWLNKSLKIKALDLYNPRHSIEMGAVFYAWLNKISDGDFEKMAIAYNAGPGRLKQWINRYYKDDFEVFLEKIPADETYYYVQKTRKNYDRYKILLGNL
jgi:soluble lytic murein transglycosylase-like protein